MASPRRPRLGCARRDLWESYGSGEGLADIPGRRVRLAQGVAFSLALAGGLLAFEAQADAPANWAILPPAQSSLSSGSPVSIGLPASLSAAQIASLAVEIDSVDVTALARISAGALVYAPPQTLGVGAHELRVVEYASNGALIPRGQWRFTVTSATKRAGAAGGWSVKGSVDATGSERVAESNLTPPVPPRFTANGTFDVKAVRTESEWTAQATIKGLYGTDNGTSAIAGQGVQPAQLQLALEHEKDNLIVGDQALPFDNLAISGLARRGLSGHLADIPLGTEVTAFSVRDSALAGFYGGLGVGDPNDIVSGAMVQTHPLASAPKALTVQAGFITGSSPGGLSTVVPYPGGNSTFPPNTPVGTVMPVQSGSGNAWVVGASSEVPGTSLHLNGQFARSNFDFSGTSGQSPTHASDDAYALGLSFAAPVGRQWTFTANTSYQDIGTYFTSLANQALPPDRRTATAIGSLSGHGVSLSGSGGFTEDNTDDNAAIATVRSLPRTLNLSYSPALSTRVTTWLGVPSMNVSWADARTHNTTLPAGSQPTDSEVVNDTLNFNFTYPHLSWQLGVTGGEFRDYTAQQDNTDTFGPTAGVNVTFGSGFASLNVQLLDAHDLKQDTHTLDRNYALSGGDTFWNSRLTGQLTLSVNHNTQQVIPGTFPPQLIGNDVVLKTATAQLTWHAILATKARGGLDVGLSCAWNESSGLNSAVLTSQGFSALATRGLQTFLTASTKWPLAIGER
jgi:hypothetical protein